MYSRPSKEKNSYEIKSINLSFITLSLSNDVQEDLFLGGEGGMEARVNRINL